MGPLSRFVAPGATREDWRFDAALASLALALIELPYLVLAWLFGQLQGSASLTAAGLTGLGMMLPIVLRRHLPLPMTALMGVFAVAQVVLVPVPTASIVVVPFAAYTVARWVQGRAARSVVLLGAVGAVLGPLRWIVVPFGATFAATVAAIMASMVCVGLVVTPYAIGRRARDAAAATQAQEEAEAERYRILLSEREQRALAAEETVRNQIARELHDVVAHSLSVIVVQAEGGRAMAMKRPEAAQQALETIAETGREALVEMRRLVGVLRQGPDDPTEAYAPSPGLAQLPAMVAKAGARLVVSGQTPEVPPTVGLAAYRIVQEALTNVLKHAGPGADPVVTATYDPARVRLEVRDAGTGPDPAADERGNGLRGMQERATAVGGTLEAGPGEAGGFVVRATLPVTTR